MRAILIDPHSRTISEIDIKKAYPDVNKAMGCEWVELGFQIDREDGGTETLYVDEEGALKSGNPVFEFHFNGDYRFCGKAVLIGTNKKGNSVSAITPLSSVKNFYVKWTSITI